MKILISIVIIAMLIAVNAFASPMPNESMQDYEKRYQKDFAPPKTACGDGLCEGREFETCPKDCKSPWQIPILENKPQSGFYNNLFDKKNISFQFGIIIFSAVVIFYIFWRRKNRKNFTVKKGAWEELGINKDYYLSMEGYILKELNKGLKLELIRKALVNAGHNDKVINNIFNKIRFRKL